MTSQEKPAKIVQIPDETQPRKCEFCGFRSNEPTMFFHHRASKHSACPSCAKVFNSQETLMKHQENKHKNEKNYKLDICRCNYCNFTPKIVIEKVPISNDKKCEFCDFRTDDQKSLLHHRASKHNACPSCDRILANVVDLVDHQYYGHKEYENKNMNKYQYTTCACRYCNYGVKMPGPEVTG